MSDLGEKARRYLVEGRITLSEIFFPEDGTGRVRLTFHAEGTDPEPYFVKAHRDAYGDEYRWTCDCPARVKCAHIVACQMILPVPPALTKEQPQQDDEISRILGTT